FLPGVFYGLLRESESRAAAILAEVAVTSDSVRERWPALKRTDLRTAGWPELTQKPRVFDENIVVVRGLCGTLRRALRNMQRLLWDFPRPMTIATEHLFLAMVTSESECGEFLRQAGLNADAIETRIRHWYGYEHRVIEGGDGRPIRISEEDDADESGQNTAEEKGRILSILEEIGLVREPSISASPTDPDSPAPGSDQSVDSPVGETKEETKETTLPLSRKNSVPDSTLSPVPDTDPSDADVGARSPVAREISEQISAWRILDAAGNRAREAIRVLEDHARFVLDHPYLTERLKRLRHELCAAIDQLPLAERLAARDTPGDVGTRITTESEL
ncbi:MAG: Clp protease N-terminal domain-containing protein, partial [Planctomycetia bacterium]|nr:Clp protease N-terminal domain-containing protein [Planctomycetia bacterium]